MRPQTACEFCRSRRRRCQRIPGTAICALCQKHNVPCIASNAPTPTKKTSHARGSGSNVGIAARPSQSDAASYARVASPRLDAGSPHAVSLPQYSSQQGGVFSPYNNDHGATDDVVLPPSAVCFHLATLYFDYVHDQLHTLFQKPAFMADMVMNKCPPVIMFAVVALSARFSTHEFFAGMSPRTRGVRYAKKSASLFDPSDVSLQSIQASVLLGACRIVEGDAPAESVYYGIACRMAQLLDLGHRVCFTRLEREINIRVWHTLCMVDEWSSTGVQVPKQIAVPAVDVPLPMEEMAFLQLRGHDTIDTVETDEFSSSSSSSLLAQMIVLNRILADVNRMNRNAVNAGTMALAMGEVESLSQRLDDWEQQLPEFIRDNPSNLAHYAAQGLGRIYVAVYLGFYHFGQLLFYQYLHNSTEESDENSPTHLLAQKCKSHAAKLCNITYTAHQTPGCDVLYNMVGHVLVIASTVQIHTLLFSTDEDEIAAAKQRLENNFEILMKLRGLWPSLDYCMMRLQAFHKACRNSMETSFKLDRWMLKFLSEFAKPVDDKPTGEGEQWVVNGIAITPMSDFAVDSMLV